MTIPDTRWTYQKRSRPKRWYLASADRFELEFTIEATTAYPMTTDGDGFDGFAVCWKGHNLFNRLIQGERIEVSVQMDGSSGLTVSLAVEMRPDYSFMRSTTRPSQFKDEPTHPFIFKTLEEAQMFVDSLMSIHTFHGSRRGS